MFAMSQDSESNLYCTLKPDVLNSSSFSLSVLGSILRVRTPLSSDLTDTVGGWGGPGEEKS